MHFRLDRFKSAHFREARPPVQIRGQFVQLLRRTDSIGFHASVIEISNPAGHSDVPGGTFHERAESDSLDPAGDQPAPCGFQMRCLQWICSTTWAAAGVGVDSIAFFTAAQRLWSWNGFVISVKPFSTT